MTKARKKPKGNPAKRAASVSSSAYTAYPVTPEQQFVLDELDFSDLAYQIGSGQLEGEDLQKWAHLALLYLFTRDDPGIEEWRRIFLVETQGMDEAGTLNYMIEQCQELYRSGMATPADGPDQ